jgi:phospholipase D1/2
LGIKDDSYELKLLQDPLSDELFKLFQERARTNTLLYREIFKCIPDDIFKTFEDFKNVYDENCIDCLVHIRRTYSELKDRIIGHIVEYPLGFLKFENLSRKIFQLERAVNIDVFL